MSAWYYKSAVELALAVRKREVSSLELLELHLARVKERNPVLNAIVVSDEEKARQRAKEADASLKDGKVCGALHGVPMTVKESYDVAGLPTTWGSPALKDNIATADASAVDALRKAGAIIFGKSNVPLMLADWQSFNAVYGSTSNPWDVTRTPGGSSGGGAASLAAGMSALELGSDIGASIRAPAHFCGVYGHKPSFGIVPQHGHSTPGGRVPSDMSVCGPLARSAEDLALALDIVAGPEPYDRDAWTLKLPGPRKTRLKDLRIALKLDDPNSAVDRGVADRVQAAADALARAGARVDDRARPRIDERRAYALYVQLLRGATGARSSDEAFARSRESAARLAPGDESSSARMLRGVVQDHRSWYVAHEERQQLRFAWAEFFRDYDALLCPAAAMAAFPHDQKVDRAERLLSVNGKQEEFNLHVPGVWAAIATLAYLPATVAPAGRTPAGLPVGVQIVGPYLQDHSTIELARLLARETEGFVAPPAYR